MKTMTDFGKYAMINLRLEIDGDIQLEMMMQPDDDGQALGIAIVNWEDFSLSDLKDIFEAAAGSLGRLLEDSPAIEIHRDTRGPAIGQDWPF